MYEDNLINDIDKDDVDLINHYKDNNKLSPDWFPIPTYDMVQSGYPRPDHGVMVPRLWAGTDKEGRLGNGSGMWCKVEDVKRLLSQPPPPATVPE